MKPAHRVIPQRVSTHGSVSALVLRCADGRPLERRQSEKAACTRQMATAACLKCSFREGTSSASRLLAMRAAVINVFAKEKLDIHITFYFFYVDVYRNLSILKSSDRTQLSISL